MFSFCLPDMQTLLSSLGPTLTFIILLKRYTSFSQHPSLTFKFERPPCMESKSKHFLTLGIRWLTSKVPLTASISLTIWSQYHLLRCMKIQFKLLVDLELLWVSTPQTQNRNRQLEKDHFLLRVNNTCLVTR